MTQAKKKQLKAGNGAIDTIYEEFLCTIKKVEKELLPDLKYICLHIDKNFKKLSKEIKKTKKLFEKHQFFDNKTNCLIYISLTIAEGLSKVASAVSQAHQYNKYLDKILDTKKKYAKAKREKIKNLFPLIENLENKILNILKKRLEESYNVKELEDKQIQEHLLDNITRETTMFKATNFYKQTVNYLLAEFDAWERGKQYSKTPRPCYHDVNKVLFNIVFGQIKPEVLISSMLIPYYEENVSASQLLLLNDDQLYSFSLQYIVACKKEYKEADIEKITEVCTHDRLLPMAQKMLNSNKAYTETRKNIDKIAFHKNKFGHDMSVILGLSLFAIDIWMCFVWLVEWPAWQRWLLFVFVGIVVGFLSGVSLFTYENEKRETDIQKSISRIKPFLQKISGYIKNDTSHLDRKSLIKVGIKKAMNMLFGD